jgi:transposase
MDAMVTIPVREYEQLIGLKETVARLREQLEWFKRQVFGQKSERFVDLPGNMDDLPGFEFPEPRSDPEPRVEVPGHQRRKRGGKGAFSVEIPDDLERVEELVDVPEEERTLPDGTKLVQAGEDRSEKLAYRPAEYYVKVTVRPKWVHPQEASFGVIQEPMPPSLIDGSKFDASFMAHVVVEKFAFHMPLYRIEEKLLGRQIRVSRQTLSQLVKACGERLLPLFRVMIAELLRQGYLFTDDTPIKLQRKGKCREARMWVYIGAQPNAPPYHVYQFSEDRGHRHPLTFLADFQGVFHADAFGAYETLHADPDNPVTWAACWAHARRKFEQANSGDLELRRWVLNTMRYLFLFERVAWSRTLEERLRIRQEKEAPLVDALFTRVRAAVAKGTLLPSSKLAKAIGYLTTREENFRLYLGDPNLRMDNNTAERGIRKLTIGRKNWMFIGSPKAGESMAALLSLVQTCRAMDINPQAYLEDLFRRLLDHPASQIADFLPDRWKAAHS